MSTLEIDVGDIRPVSVAFTADELVVTLADGRKIATPLAWYPRLREANVATRARFELMPMGIAIGVKSWGTSSAMVSGKQTTKHRKHSRHSRPR